MNAYELAYKTADEIENRNAEYYVADMLRQQADHIAELQENYKSACMEIRCLENEVAKLEKQLKTQKIGNALVKAVANFPVATPTKTLTDEEIENIAYKVFEVGDGKEALFNFARAILRKAQEK